MDYQNGTEIYQLNIYTSFEVLRGEIGCPTGLRLSDLFNISKTDFLEFINVRDSSSENAEPDKHRSFIRKDQIQIVGVSPADAGRGIGAKSDAKSYPFVPKNKINVTLQSQTCHISGSINMREGQTIESLLQEDKQFLPITEAAIEYGQGTIDPWPFAMVNKKHLFRLEENQIEAI